MQPFCLPFIGFKYQHTLIRIEAYLLYVFAMSKLFWLIILKSDVGNFEISYFLTLTSFTIFSIAIYKIVAHYNLTSTKIENFIKQSCIEIYGISSVILVCSLLIIFSDVARLWLFLPVILCLRCVPYFLLYLCFPLSRS